MRSRKDIDRRQRKLLNFVDRREHLRLLEDESLAIGTDGAVVVVFYGMGGQGKSLLLQKFEQQIKHDQTFSHLKCVHIDFTQQTQRDEWRPLVWIRNPLATQEVRFPRFDLGFELFWLGAFAEQPRPHLEKRWLQRTSDLSEAGIEELSDQGLGYTMEVLTDSVLDSLPFVGRAFGRMGRAFIDRRMRERLIAANDSLAALFDGNQLRPSGEIASYLPLLLAEDLVDHRSRNPRDRFVIVLDEFERLLEQGGAPERTASSPIAETVEAIVAEISAALIVVGSRERINWSRLRHKGQAIQIQHIRLDGLPLADAHMLLKNEEIEDQAVSQILISTAQMDGGDKLVYPLILDLQIDYFRSISDDKSNVPIAIDTFRSDIHTFEEQRNAILVRLLRDYQPPLQATIRRLAVCESFDRLIFDFIVKTFLTGQQLDSWDVMVELSFVYPAGDPGSYVMHQAVRDALVAAQSPDNIKATHAALASHLSDRIDLHDLSAFDHRTVGLLEQAFNHRLALGLDGMADWWGARVEFLFKAGRHRDVARITRRLVNTFVSCSRDDEPDALRSLAQWAEARKLSGAFAEEVAPELEPRWAKLKEIGRGDEPESLLIAEQIIPCQMAAGKYIEATVLASDVCSVRKRVLGEGHPHTIRVLVKLAEINLHVWGEPELAEDLFPEAVTAVTRQLGADHPETLEINRQHAEYLSSRGRYREAEVVYRTLLSRSEHVFGPSQLSIIAGLAHVHSKLNEHEHAEEFQRRALDRASTLFGLEHPHTLTAADHLSKTLTTLGRFADAKKISEQTLSRRIRSKGDKHVDTLENADRVALIISNLGELQEAITLFRVTLDTKIEVLGWGRSTTWDTLGYLANALVSAGQFEEAAQRFSKLLSCLRRPSFVSKSELDCAIALIRVLKRLGRRGEARQLLEEYRNYPLRRWERQRSKR